MRTETREVKFMRPTVTWTERTMGAGGDCSERMAESMLADKLADEARLIEEAVRMMLEVARSLRSEQETSVTRLRWMMAEEEEK